MNSEEEERIMIIDNLADAGVVTVVVIAAIGIAAIAVYAMHKLLQYISGIEDDDAIQGQDEGDGT